MASSSEGTSSPSEAGEPDEDQKEHSSPSHLALALIPEDASISRIGVEEVTVTGDISPNPVNVIFLDSSPIYRRPLKNQEIVLAHRRDKGYWCRAAILRKTYCSNQMTKEITTKHQVHYEDGVRPVEPLSLDEIAYSEVCRKLIPVGTPVVTDISDTCIKFTPGVIIETPTFLNRNRYAVMSPKGTARYVEHSDIRIVAGTNFSFDSDQFDPDFLLDHMEIYPNYVTVRMKPGGNAIFNRNKEWTSGKVISIDCSIVQILFDDGDVESYHRGSYRNHRLIFEPLADAISKMGVPRLKRLRSSVNRRIMRAGRSISTEQCGVSAPLKPTSTVCLSRKRPDPAQCLKPITPILKYYRRPAGLHHCDRSCAVPVDVILKLDPKLGPLIRPLFLGFKREPGGALGVTYTAPCGQKISNFDQLLTFLNQTMVHLSVTNFDFTPEINPKRIFDPDPEFVFAKMDDISEGLEDGGISVVNEYDSDLPDAFIYQNHRVFAGGRGVDTDFVSGCSCEDNCQNLLTCECASLTVESYLSWNCHSTTTLEPQQIGYQHKRLLNEIPTGIYECNKRCKCGPNCPRRLVQHPSEVKFQLFSTRGKGWGVRTLYDVPKGMMVSVYLGTILNEFDAERWGSVYGDAYLTDLDFIYKAESRKPDYEDCPVDVNDNAAVKKDDTEPGTPQKTKAGRTVRERVVIQKKKKYKLKNNGRSRRVKSLRRFFPKGEAEFTIDAKLSGNISKYFNHSCNPNMFVQNVFVDTHDPRLPWVAFFTKNNIVAGTELTWDYDYVIGSVKNRFISCMCLEPNCRKRLI